MKKSLKIYRGIGEKYYVCVLDLGLAGVQIAMSDFAIAYQYLMDAQMIAKEIGAKDLLKNSNEIFSLYYKETHDFEKALEYYKLFSDQKDSLFDADTKNTVKQMQAEYEANKKEAEITSLKQNTQLLYQRNQIQRLQIDRNGYFIAGLIGFVMLAVVIFLLLINRNKIINNIQKAELEQKLLRSQMDPHFVFNSLVAIQNFIYDRPPEEAADYVSSFAKLMRLTLEASRQDRVSIEKEVSILRHYLLLQQLRFNNSFVFEINVDDAIDAGETTIPPFFAQPFVENAIEHGILNKQDGKGFVSLRFSIDGDNVVLEILDNGIGRVKAKAMRIADHLSLATSITQERLTVLNKKSKQKITLQIYDLVGQTGVGAGTKVVLRLPYS